MNNHSTKQKSVISFGLSLCETKEICSEDSAQIIKNGMSINLLNDIGQAWEQLGREEMDLRLVSIWDTKENWNLDTIL